MSKKILPPARFRSILRISWPPNLALGCGVILLSGTFWAGPSPAQNTLDQSGPVPALIIGGEANSAAATAQQVFVPEVGGSFAAPGSISYGHGPFYIGSPGAAYAPLACNYGPYIGRFGRFSDLGLGFGATSIGFGGLSYGRIGTFAGGFGGYQSLSGFGGCGGYDQYGGWGMGSANPELGRITTTRVIQTAPSKASGNYYAPSTVDTTASGSYYAGPSSAPMVLPLKHQNSAENCTKPQTNYWGSEGSPFPKDLNSVPWSK